MDVGGIRKFAGRRSPRPMLVGTAACTLLAVPLIWTVRQTRLTREALDRAAAAEKAAAQVRSDLEQSQARAQAKGQPPRDPTVRRSRHDDPEEIARVKQLYAEIESLTRIQERVEERLGDDRAVLAEKVPPTGRGEGSGAEGRQERPSSAPPRP
jgi:uncharacterized protein (DUF1800 family)